MRTSANVIFYALLGYITFWSLPAQAQSPLIEVGIGYSSAWINGANPATAQIIPAGGGGVLPYGGGFSGQQPGISLRARFGMDSTSRFRAILGLDYFFYRGSQRSPFPTGTYYDHMSLNLPTIVLGPEIVILDFNSIAKLYCSVEGRGAFVQSTVYSYEGLRSDGTPFESLPPATYKDPVFRFGTALRLGVEGEFEERIHVDMNFGYGAINIVGRDNERGELLTSGFPNKEDKENIVGNILFSLMIMYRF